MTLTRLLLTIQCLLLINGLTFAAVKINPVKVYEAGVKAYEAGNYNKAIDLLEDAIEAGLSGCNMVLSESDWSFEHFGDLVTYVNPDSIPSIKAGILSALNKKAKVKELKNKLEHHLSEQNINKLYGVLQEVF